MKPNILILHADQLRQDCLGVYGNKDVKTPNIDSLANQGVQYNQHYTVYPVCTASRYSLVSGLYTHQHTAWTNVSTLPTGFKTFPSILKENNYRTTAVGKMHFTPTYKDVGYESMILAEQNGEGRFEDDYHTYLMEQGLIDSIDLVDQVDDIRKTVGQKYYDHFGAFTSDLSLEHHSTTWITKQAINDINQWNNDGGNLLFVGYIKPHHPFDPPKPYNEMYDPNKLNILDGYINNVLDIDYNNQPGFFDNKTLSENKLRKIMANYYGTITQIDDNIGEIIQLLKEKGIYDNTIIIFTSDHGEYLGYHHMLLKGNFLYDPLARIPLIIKYTKSMNLHGITDALSENIDIATTILNCCNTELPDTMDGLNLADFNNGREYVFSEGQYGTDRNPKYGYMIRSKNYKLIVHGSFEESMFFDLNNDKFELNNLINNKNYKEEIEKHKNYLIELMLFKASSKNHCDINSKQLSSSDILNSRTAKLHSFINEKVHEIKHNFN